MVLKLNLLLVLGVLSAAIQRTTSRLVDGPYCFEDDCYIRPDTDGKPWMEAQQMCRKYNSTLPIVDSQNRQRSLAAALDNFTVSHNSDVWLGANASDYDPSDWRWVDGNQYTGTFPGSGVGMYNKSYALLWKNASTFFLTASEPYNIYNSYSYICQYNTTAKNVCTNGTGPLTFVLESRCYVKYDIALSWFNARNACLADGGDLASFNNISLLHGISFNATGSWIGLRSSHWFWRNAVTGSSSDVTFSVWASNQPNDATPTCIRIDFNNFPQWKDTDCSNITQYICQVLNVYPMEESPTSRVGLLSTTPRPPTEALGTAGNSSAYQVNVPLAVGLAVGLGGAAIIALIIIIIVVVVRRKHRNSRSFGNSKSRETFDDDVGRTKPEEEDEATEMNEAGSQSRFEDAPTAYATVQEARGSDQESQLSPPSTNQGLVYADLGFDQGTS